MKPRLWECYPRTRAVKGPRLPTLRLKGHGFIIIESVHKRETSLSDYMSGLYVFYPLTGSECDEEDVEFEESDSDESWTTESAISSESILSSMCMNGGDEKPFACPVPGCKKRYKVHVIHVLLHLIRILVVNIIKQYEISLS